MKTQLIKRVSVIPILALLGACSGSSGGDGGGGGGGGGAGAAGILDASFGTNGVVVDDGAAGGSDFDVGVALALDAGGRILVAGYSTNAGGDEDMTLWRFTSSGVLDSSFGSGGVVIDDNAAGGSDADIGNAVAIDAGGRIVVAGYSWNGSNDDLTLWRFTSSGVLDSSFGTNGVVIHDNAAGGSGTDRALALVLDAGGNILVVGHSTNASGDNDMALWRFTSGGVLDAGFGTNGVVTHDNAAGGSGDDIGVSLALDAGGNIVVAGASTNASGDGDMALWRFTPSGALDTNFGTNGVVAHDNAAGGSGNDLGFALALDAGGNILVAGDSRGVGSFDMTLCRYR